MPPLFLLTLLALGPEAPRPAVMVAPCGQGMRRWVAVAVGPGLSAQVPTEAFLGILSTLLRERGVDTCPVDSSPGHEPDAEVDLEAVRDVRDRVRLHVRMADKTVPIVIDETIDLQSVPPDGRPLALAASTDELLRAHWTAPATVPATMPGLAETGAPLSPTAPSRRGEIHPLEVSLGVAAMASAGGQKQGGMEIRVYQRLLHRLGASLHGARRWSVTEHAEGGVIGGLTWQGGLAALLPLTDGEDRLSVALAGGVDYARVQFDALATAPAVAHPATAEAWLLAAGMHVSFRLTGPVILVGSAGAHRSIRGAAATQTRDHGAGSPTTETLTSLSGFGLDLTIGLGVRI